jgi:hypothetical protein
MMNARADKTRYGAVMAAVSLVFLALVVGACSKSSRDLNIDSRSDAAPSAVREVESDPAAANWHASAEPQDGKKKDKKKSSDKNAQKPPEGSKPGSASGSGGGPSHTWALILGTFTEPGHEEAAKRMIVNLAKIAPQATDKAWVHTTGKGSMVVYGRYAGREDPAAAADEQRLKQITYQNQRLFNRIILTHLDLRLTQGQLSPNDLLSARKKHPKVDPLYTLDVAVWLPNEDPEAGRDRLGYDVVKKRAEEHAAKLRAQGYEAYFYHDETNKRSSVTVGLFDRRAINSKSGLYSDDVMALVHKFPIRLANGEPINELKAKYLPQLGTKPQTPVLVLVPML